jgi:hypothetical protein
MNWNYRILAHTDSINQPLFQLHEVYYEGKEPKGYIETPSIVTGEDIEELRWHLVRMEEALQKPILWAGDLFPLEYKS